MSYTTLEDDLVKRLISESHEIVFNKLTKKVKNNMIKEELRTGIGILGNRNALKL
ncbi:MAG: hypothetical protein OCD02_06700 [Spirochaetaceae bacterium]